MKRYFIHSWGDIEVKENKDGDFIYYDDFVDVISARIKELETEIENEDSEYSVVNCRFAIKELKNLIK